jgi:hypothetical protein
MQVYINRDGEQNGPYGIEEVSGKIDELECSIIKKDARDFTVKNTANKEK